MGRDFWKKYHGSVPIFVRTAQSSYIAIDEKWFLKYVVDGLRKLYDWYIGQFPEEHKQLDNSNSLYEVTDLTGSAVESVDVGTISVEHPISLHLIASWPLFKPVSH